MWCNYLDGYNVHTIPEDDAVEHTVTHRCYCRPRWEAVWSMRGIVWHFIHSALDGRE